MAADKTEQQAAGLFKAGSLADDALEQARAYEQQQLGAAQALLRATHTLIDLQTKLGEREEDIERKGLVKDTVGKAIESLKGMTMQAEAGKVAAGGRVSQAQRTVELLKKEYDKLMAQARAQRDAETRADDDQPADGPRAAGVHPGPPPKLRAELEDAAAKKPPRKKAATKKKTTRSRKKAGA